MITTHEKFRITSEDKEDIIFEVNWNVKDDKINDCKLLKMILPDGKEYTFKKEFLNSVLFAIGTADEQRKMIPQVIRKTRWYETVISVKAKKDIIKGEDITFPLKITLPSVEEEAIAEIKKEAKDKGKLWTPK